MRAPPESLRPTIGAPTFIARSMTLQIFSAYASDSEPPKTVKSWLKTKTSRPSIVPWPVTTPSPRMRWLVAGRSRRRDGSTNASSSTNEPGVEQELEPLARGQLARGVLLVDALLAAAELRLGAHRRSRSMRSSFVGTVGLAPGLCARTA